MYDMFNLVNSNPKTIVRLEILYELHHKFNVYFNYKTNNSSTKYEVINLGTKNNLHNINLGTNCTPK